ncbi:hypothetical protein F2Q68_00012552 [Brassica cretica]|nr:hypothetical protein F2Q68_00012552 [Brassica cretica]
MSGLCVDEHINFGNSSGEFYGDDDGIVPDSACEDGCQFPVLVGSRKKQRHEDMGSGTNHLKSKDVQDMTLEDTKISDHGVNSENVNMVENLCSADPMLCDSPTATNDGVYNIYSLNNIPDAENNLSFMSDGDEESSDLFYGWGDMGNFEDVDNMLR